MLGYLTWMHIACRELTYSAVEGLPGIALPSKPLPVDVFRRITGVDGKHRYSLEDEGEVVLEAVTVKPPSDRMLTRHLVAHVNDGEGVTQKIVRVGDAAFYKPPKGQHSKARLRVTTVQGLDGIRKPVEAYAETLRNKYDVGIAGQLDDQAVRRLVRNHLAENQALYMEGPYFHLDTDLLAPLYPLFELLGPDSLIHSVPLPDSSENRDLVRRMVERSEARSTAVDARIHRLLQEEE